MVAVMVEEPRRQWIGLEPEGEGHEMLVTWGLFRRGREREHSPVTSGAWSEPLDKAYDAEPPFVIEIDHLFARLIRSNCEHSVDIAKRFYLEHPRLSMWELSAKAHRTEGFVRLTLRGICSLVEQIPQE